MPDSNIEYEESLIGKYGVEAFGSTPSLLIFFFFASHTPLISQQNKVPLSQYVLHFWCLVFLYYCI